MVFKLLLAELSTGRPRPPIHHSNSSWSHRSSLVMVMLVKPSSVAMCCILLYLFPRRNSRSQYNYNTVSRNLPVETTKPFGASNMAGTTMPPLDTGHYSDG